MMYDAYVTSHQWAIGSHVSNEHSAFIFKNTVIICIFNTLEGEDSTLPRNAGHHLPIVAASHPRRTGLSISPVGEPQNTAVTCLLFRKSVTRMEAGVFVLLGWKHCMDNHRRRSA